MTDIELATAQLQWLTHAPDLILPPESLRLPAAFTLELNEVLLKLAEDPGRLLVDRREFGKGRLGKQFEDLTSLYFRLNCQIIDIKRNIQIKKDNITLGELDFMIQLPDRWVHLEVAVKFYLLDGDGSHLDHFIGPGRADKLGAKWRHMIHHQLPIAYSPAGLSTLASLGIDDFTQAAWVKGALFYHWQQESVPAIPLLVNPSHDRGWWVRHSELTSMKEHYKVNNIQLISKPDWLMPIDVLGTYHQQSLSDIQIESLQHPVMAAVLTGNGDTSRGFIVPDDWGIS
ncbi:DUF1853 family protein [Nitrincola sp. MINF-07-Sa-05]|uniref:DUF1853 family protein n=1 Tax=Nitrincola salilacus TaxID=3400273 RepID=UPI003917BD81